MHFPTHSGFFRGGCCVLGNFAARSFRKRISRVESCLVVDVLRPCRICC